MPQCVLIVEFGLHPGAWPAFAGIMLDHAAKTLAEEPGCRRFDVLRAEHEDGSLDESRVFLVEVYDDRAAYEAHRSNPRMPGVNEAITPLLTSRARTICQM